MRKKTRNQKIRVGMQVKVPREGSFLKPQSTFVCVVVKWRLLGRQNNWNLISRCPYGKGGTRPDSGLAITIQVKANVRLVRKGGVSTQNEAQTYSTPD